MRAAIPNGTVNPPYDEIGECIHLETSEKLRSFFNALSSRRDDLRMMLQFALEAMSFISPTDSHILYVCDAV